jgi:hypothetical protein
MCVNKLQNKIFKYFKMKHFLYDTTQLLQQIVHLFLPVFLAFLSFIQPIQIILLAVGAMIFLDTIIARVRVSIYKKRNKDKLKKGLKISEEEIEAATWTSRKMRFGLVPKMLSYQLIVLTFFTIDVAILNEVVNIFTKFDFLLTKITALVFIYVEFLSINESIKIIKGKSIIEIALEMLKNASRAKKHFEKLNEGKKQIKENNDENDKK